jgi:hypothetical protein
VQLPTVFHDTTHAGVRRRERQLPLAEMQGVVRQHQRRIQHQRGEHGGFVYESHQRLAAKRLVVIAELKKQECWLITGYHEED